MSKLKSDSKATGLFITLEGGEGAGKSTQATRLAERLRQLGFTVIQTREPGGSASAEEVRNLLVTGSPDRWTPNAETLLNFAARDSHLNEKIRPALEKGHIIICDRFMDSTRAYQGAAGGVDANLIATLEKTIIGDTTPDLTLIFDIDPTAGLARTTTRNQSDETRFEQKNIEFHQTLRQAFLDLTKSEPHRCVLIDAAQDIEDVFDQIWSKVEPKIAIR